MIKNELVALILLWRLNDWGLYNRRHEALARGLSERDSVHRVLHVEHASLRGLLSLILRWMKEKDRLLKRNCAVHIRKGFSLRPIVANDSDKLFVYSVVSLYSGDNTVLKKINDFIKRVQYRMLNACMDHSHTRKVLLVYPPSGSFPEAIKNIKHDVLIADLVDDNISRAGDRKKKMLLIDNYRSILEKCRWVFSTSPIFGETYMEYARQPIDYLPNGVDCTHILKRSSGNGTRRKGRKKIGYIGIMNNEVNMELLGYIVSDNRESDFYLVGSATNDRLSEIRRMTSLHANLFYLGPKSHDEIPDIMEQFDVLINIKNNDQTTSGADSIKIYEYLATGKPIVASPMPPADRFADLIYVAENKVLFSKFIRMAIEENDSALQKMRRAVAENNSWGKRVDVVLEKVTELI